MNKLIILFILSTYLIFSQSSGSSIINIDGEYARRLYAGERMDECRVACIDSAKNNLIDNYIFNRFSDHTFSDAERKLCIIELKPLLGEINIITETDITRRRQGGGKYIKLNAEIDDNIFYQKVQQIIQ
tara:strand:+ start:56 stop:442 length:387 start_codon:yes stop_codon:yes gene_type:complete